MGDRGVSGRSGGGGGRTREENLALRAQQGKREAVARFRFPPSLAHPLAAVSGGLVLLFCWFVGLLFGYLFA